MLAVDMTEDSSFGPASLPMVLLECNCRRVGFVRQGGLAHEANRKCRLWSQCVRRASERGIAQEI